MVLKIVQMFSVSDDDRHLARRAGGWARAGVRHDGDTQLLSTASQRPGMLKHKGAAAALQGSTNPLHRDVTGRPLDGGHRGEHLALADSFEIAVELLVNGHPADGRLLGLIVRLLRGQLYLKRSLRVSRHDGLLLHLTGNRRLGLPICRCAKGKAQADAHDDGSSNAKSIPHTLHYARWRHASIKPEWLWLT